MREEMMIIGAETGIGQGLGHPSTRKGATAQDQEREEDIGHAVDHHETGGAVDEAALGTGIEETGGEGKGCSCFGVFLTIL